VIKSTLPLLPGCIRSLEDALYEIAPNNWSLTVNSDDGHGKIEGFFSSIDDAQEAISELESIWENTFNEEFHHEELEDMDWAEAYKLHFKPWSNDTIHWVPEWEKETYPVPPGHHALYLDPGMAFGTGNHETTRLCLESLISISKLSLPLDLIDVGCGSGILSLSASLLGIENVIGVDNDADCIKVSRDNLNANNISAGVTFENLPLENLSGSEPVDVVLANIQADILMANACVLHKLVRNEGYLVLSGILSKELKAVEEHFLRILNEDSCLYETTTRNMGEWSLLQIKISDRT